MSLETSNLNVLDLGLGNMEFRKVTSVVFQLMIFWNFTSHALMVD